MRAKETFGKSMMQTSELLWLAKDKSQDEAMLISQKSSVQP